MTVTSLPAPREKMIFSGKTRLSVGGWPLALLLCLAASPAASATPHMPLLPRPQHIVYGEGQLALQGLQISLPADAAAEDNFAAQRLSACLGSRNDKGHGDQPLSITSSPSTGPVIRLRRTGAIDALPQPGEAPGPHSREAYSIEVTSGGGVVEAQSSAGLFYGTETLCQLVEGGAIRSIPAVRIEDWPAAAYRGTMVDMSEGPLPTEQEIKRQIDFLARWKANQYYFYNESNIELAGYPLLNPEARFTREQIQSIVAYARERHIDVVPCLELYGHLHDLFRIEKYSSLADFPHGGEFNPRDPRVMQLLTDWADQFSAIFPSPFVHIGFDETWQIQQAAAQQGSGTTAVDLFVQQLSNVSRLFEQRHKTVMAWADIMVKYPGIIAKLPPGTIAVAWYYDPSPDPEYKRWLDPLVRKKIPHLVAPGINSWSEIYPDYDLTFANIDTFVAAGRRSGALGVMNTIWTDDAQMLMRLSWPGIAYGAAAAWQTEPVAGTSFFADYASQVYPASTAGDVAAALVALNASELRLQHAIGQDTMDELWGDPFAPSRIQRSARHRDDLRQSRILAEEAAEALARATASRHDPETGAANPDAASPDNLDELIFASRLLDYAGLKFQYGAEIADEWRALGAHPSRDRLNEFVGSVTSQQHGKLPDLMDAITGLRPHYEKAWLAEYSSYRMENALGRWDAEYQALHRLQTRLQSYPDHHRPGAALPSFQSIAGAWD
jgi:hexosaminidase